MSPNIRRLGGYLLLAFAVVSGGIAWWQVADAQQLASRPDNPQVIATRRSALRGTIFDAKGTLLASSRIVAGISRRAYVDPAFSHVIGYASLRFGTTGLERAFDDLLTGRADPNPLRDVFDDILGRQPQPKDLTLTVDVRIHTDNNTQKQTYRDPFSGKTVDMPQITPLQFSTMGFVFPMVPIPGSTGIASLHDPAIICAATAPRPAQGRHGESK